MSGRSSADRSRAALARDERGATPAVGKSLEATVVILFIGLLVATLFGNVVPDYRTAAGDEVADRTLSAAAHRVADAVPATEGSASARQRVDLPETIRGEDYRIRVDGRDLVLVHPDRGVGDRVRLSLPDRVATVTGEWYSRLDPVVVVEETSSGLAVRLEHAGSGSPSLASPALAPTGGDRR